MLFNWIPGFVPNKIVVFGCGGTGSRVVPLLAQFIKSCAWVVDPEIILVDFDKVEEKNLGRQNFIVPDVGRNKAVVLANRYSRAFNITITAIEAKLGRNSNIPQEREASNTFDDMVSANERRNFLFILCVDSPEARREIMTELLHVTGTSFNNLVIDAGNENDFGQVVITSLLGIEYYTRDLLTISELKEDTPVTMNLKAIPLNISYYNNMVAVTKASCAELDQTMAINTLMAANIFSMVQNVYYAKPISFFRVNISLQYGAIPEYINLNYIKKCINESDPSNKLDMRYLIRNTKKYPIDMELKKLMADQVIFLLNKQKEEARLKEEARILEEAKLKEEAELKGEANSTEEKDELDSKSNSKIKEKVVKKKKIPLPVNDFVADLENTVSSNINFPTMNIPRY